MLTNIFALKDALLKIFENQYLDFRLLKLYILMFKGNPFLHKL